MQVKNFVKLTNPTKKLRHNKRLCKIELNEYFSPTFEVDVAQQEGPLKKSQKAMHASCSDICPIDILAAIIK
jgi:hypothetical protein